MQEPIPDDPELVLHTMIEDIAVILVSEPRQWKVLWILIGDAAIPATIAAQVRAADTAPDFCALASTDVTSAIYALMVVADDRDGLQDPAMYVRLEEALVCCAKALAVYVSSPDVNGDDAWHEEGLLQDAPALLFEAALKLAASQNSPDARATRLGTIIGLLASAWPDLATLYRSVLADQIAELPVEVSRQFIALLLQIRCLP